MAGNKCSVCGKFRSNSELVEHDERSLGILGELYEKWWLECDSCRGAVLEDSPPDDDLGDEPDCMCEPGEMGTLERRDPDCPIHGPR